MWRSGRPVGAGLALPRRDRRGAARLAEPVWDEGTGHEVSAALAVSLPGADKLLNLAWTLRARLPRIGALLAGGVIDAVKAGIIVTEFLVLDDEKAAAAEALIAHQLAGKTASQIGRRPHLHPRTHEVPRRDETIPLRTNKALSCLITGSTSIGADCSRRAGGVRRGAVPT